MMIFNIVITGINLYNYYYYRNPISGILALVGVIMVLGGL